MKRPTTPTALDTDYAGVHFRSRLEARWAVFFDVLGVSWRYEPGGYEVGPTGHRRKYLPDFHLPATGTWIEVKGNGRPLDYELIASAVHPQCGLPGDPPALLVLGDIPHADRTEVPWHHLALTRNRRDDESELGGHPVVAAQQVVRFVGGAEVLEPVVPISYGVGGYGADGRFHARSKVGWTAACLNVSPWGSGAADADWADLNGPVATAYEAAAAARFEHGAGRRYRRGEVR